MAKAKQELEEQLKLTQEELVTQKETCQDLLKRISEIEQEYEEKMSRKEQQLWSANAKLVEGNEFLFNYVF
jgi:hypothetical protein